MNLKIHHIAVICSDYEKSRHFYTEILGLPIVRENYRAARDSWKLDLQLGDAELEIFSMPNPPLRVTGPEAAGLRHLAFYVSSVADTVAALAAKGVVCEPVRMDEYSGKPFTFFFDPDGTPLELHE